MASDEREDSRKSDKTMHTENPNLVECPLIHEQHRTNLPLLPMHRPAGVSVMQPIAQSEPGHRRSVATDSPAPRT